MNTEYLTSVNNKEKSKMTMISKKHIYSYNLCIYFSMSKISREQKHIHL